MPPHWPPDRELVGGQPPADEAYIWVSAPGSGFGSGRTQVSCGISGCAKQVQELQG